ncbi:MAG TPA: hypothetical protein VIV12_13365 [Streptosporangiaceae bacterium]
MTRGDRTVNIPYDGTPPDVGPGDEVRCRTANGDWVRHVARSTPRYDRDNAIGGRCFLTVAVTPLDEWRDLRDDARWVNWPAEDVRP